LSYETGSCVASWKFQIPPVVGSDASGLIRYNSLKNMASIERGEDPMGVIKDPTKNESVIGSFVCTSHDRKFAAPQHIGARLFYAVSAVKLVDEAASIELLNKFCIN
jgi:hypothetical protein